MSWFVREVTGVAMKEAEFSTFSFSKFISFIKEIEREQNQKETKEKDKKKPGFCWYWLQL